MPPSAAPEWLRTGWIFETIATSAPASYASIAARIPAQPAPTTTTSCTASTCNGRYLIAWPPLPANERRANARHGAHGDGAGPARALARAGPRAELPALRGGRRQACRLVGRERRGAPRLALDPARGANGSPAADADGQPVRRRSEERGDGRPGPHGDRAVRGPRA